MQHHALKIILKISLNWENSNQCSVHRVLKNHTCVFQLNFLHYLIIRATNWIKISVVSNPLTDVVIVNDVLLKI